MNLIFGAKCNWHDIFQDLIDFEKGRQKGGQVCFWKQPHARKIIKDGKFSTFYCNHILNCCMPPLPPLLLIFKFWKFTTSDFFWTQNRAHPTIRSRYAQTGSLKTLSPKKIAHKIPFTFFQKFTGHVDTIN